MILLLIAGCQIIPPPKLMPFSDNNDWMLFDDLKYSIGNTGVSITIPRGFVTDFASIPQFLWSFGLSPHGKYSKAAIVHDYLYPAQNRSKEQADNILLIAMKESGVCIYEGVHVGGWPSWNSNTDERNNYLPRVIPTKYQDFPGEVTWKEYRQFIASEGVKDPVFDSGVLTASLGTQQAYPARANPAMQPASALAADLRSYPAYAKHSEAAPDWYGYCPEDIAPN